MTEIGTVIDGKYEVLREIGRGGMSVVYLAMDTHLNKQWAVKEIRKKGSGKNDEIVVNSLLAEANMMKRLDHPALPRIVDIIDNGVTIYVVMDYIEGESLDKILLEYGAQPEEKVINWAMQIADALSYLHGQKPPIIYRDMKPANVMLKPEGNIKIIDFGIAREYKEQNLADTTVLGTKGYAPPEQYSGQTDPRSDIFALGMTMHHLLTGVDPRNGEPYAPVRQWNPELSEGIEIIIDRCVQPASENRYQSCADLIYDLEHPELITKGFKRKQKQRLASFLVAAILSVVMLISGVACNFAATQVNNNTYEAYIAATNDITQYKQAIALYPQDPRAYDRILDTFESNIQEGGTLSESDWKQFEAVYSATDDEKFLSDPQGFAELNFRAASLCFTYYTPQNGDSFAGRINKAFVYLSKNHSAIENGLLTEYENMNLAECYYQICSFYKTYILSQTADDASASDYQNLFDSLNGLLDRLESDNSANKYDKLVLYNSIFFLLYDRCDEIASTGFEQDNVLELFDRVYESGTGIQVSESKVYANNLQKEMETKYQQYRDAIVRAYSNAGKRS